jgi:hypothetical protein
VGREELNVLVVSDVDTVVMLRVAGKCTYELSVRYIPYDSA